MPEPAALPRQPLRLVDLPRNRPRDVALSPGPEERAAIADVLGIVAVRKLRLEGTLTPEGRADWRLDARLGATVVQDCVVTLAPVTTRIDEAVLRRYRADLEPPTGSEIEMPEDDTEEALPAELDLAAVMIEALALALPPYPRADGAEPLDIVVTEPGKTPMTRDAARPFAGLAGLRARMKDEGDGPE